jgi:uncharacterized protein (DUF302 family)
MKKLGYILGGFAGGVMFLLIVGASLTGGQMFLVSESKYGFSETVDMIESVSKEKGWTVSHIYNLQATMSKNGYQVKPVTVFSLCKPQIAYQVLSSDNERPVAAMMPCRVAVYETKDGKTYVSRMNAGILSSMLTGVSRDAMSLASQENEIILKSVIKE